MWDIWAVAAIIIECDMEIDFYLKTMTEANTKYKIKQHYKKHDPCSKLRELMDGTILLHKQLDMISLEQVKRLLLKIKFTKYRSDAKSK